MNEFHRDYLNVNKSLPKYHHILDYVYFNRYGHQHPTYLPWIFMSKLFFFKVWLKNTLPTYSLDICPNFCSFFGRLPLPWFKIAFTNFKVGGWVDFTPIIKPLCSRTCLLMLKANKISTQVDIASWAKVWQCERTPSTGWDFKHEPMNHVCWKSS